MNTAQLKQKLHDYINTAENKKLKAIYTILESEIEDASDWHNEEELIAELDRRDAELVSGKVKGVTWEVVKERALKSIEANKVKA